MKWVEIAYTSNKERLDILAEKLKSQGSNIDIDYITVQDSDWKEKVNLAMKVPSVIRIGPGLRRKVLTLFDYTEIEARQLGAADNLFFEADRWWPRCSLYSGLVHAIAEVGAKFQLGTEVLIAGSGALARIALAALFKEGFKHFTVVDNNIKEAEELVQFTNRHRLGAKIRFIPREGLIVLPSDYGVCVNAIQNKESADLIFDLAYFNFLIPKGYLIDFQLEEGESSLTKEAQTIGAYTLTGPRIFAHADALWAYMVEKRELSVDELTKSYQEKFQPKV